MTKVSEDNYTMKVDIKPKIIMRLLCKFFVKMNSRRHMICLIAD